MKITGFLVMDGNGDEIPADTHGNNLSVNCQVCGHPMLFVALENQRGSDEKHPADCKQCGQLYFMDARERTEKIYVFNLALFEDDPESQF